jgi:hypothetical protein
MWALYPSEESKKKVTADMEIARQQMDLIASGPLSTYGNIS